MSGSVPSSDGDVSKPHVSSDAPSFSLETPAESLFAYGIRLKLAPGPIATLSQRASNCFTEMDSGPDLLVGALPFDRESDDHLFQPQSVVRKTSRVAGVGRSQASSAFDGDHAIVKAEPSAADYSAAVAKCLAIMQSAPDQLTKVVLARSLLVTTDRTVNPEGLLRQLSRDPSITAFLSSLPERRDGTSRVLVGATPELLVSKSGLEVNSYPLAGSARRFASPADDKRSAEALQNSDKDHREHRAVVDAVLDALAPHCTQLGTPGGTTLHPTASMWHLGSRIVGRLKDRDTPVLELVAALHPTPAVCGLPRDRARAVIGELEAQDRGFYAGAVGWTNAAGDGAWHVSIRCAEIAGPSLRLFAGAGIVAGSDPVAEADETSAKFLAMLGALGVDEHGRPVRERAA